MFFSRDQKLDFEAWIRHVHLYLKHICCFLSLGLLKADHGLPV